MTATMKAKRTEGGLEEILEGFGLTTRDMVYDLPIELARELIQSDRWQSVTEEAPLESGIDEQES